ncbi:MAG TPA: efflux RND transporter periplasmic adaptor subunit [Candidatus Xenobia bacterium]|nr:efflux RND transporter periplasmic adaptor subunit [Candidatus Xenobia bacterium]
MRIPGIGFVGTFYRNHRSLAVLLVLAAIVVVALATFGFTRRDHVQYFPATVEQGDIQAVVNATGTINAVTTVQVGSQVSGNIAELHADFNSHVTQGQVVARIDPAIFQTRVLQVEADLANAQAGVVTAQANLSRAEANLRQAELNLKRTLELFGQGIASAQERDSVQAAYDTAVAEKQAAEAQIHQARAQVKQRQAALEQARLDLQHTVIKAPIEGTVIARNVDIGQTVAASLQAPTLFTIAQDLTKMLVYAKTDESDVGKIRVGAQATFKVDSFPNETFHGRVTQVRMNATTIQNVVTYDTIIEFDNPQLKLMPGMTAYVTIPVASAKDVVKIPNGALRYTPDLPDEERRALLKKYNLLGPPPEEPKKEGEGAAQAQDKPPGEGQGGGGRGGWGNMSEEERAKMRERFRNMSPEDRARMRQMFMAQRQAQQQQGGFQGPPTSGPGAEGAWQIVWKLNPDNTLQPIRVKTGITDMAFTAMLAGDLKPGDKLVIAQTGGKSATQSQPFGRGGPMRF